MIDKIDIRIEIEILNDTLSIIGNYRLVNALNIMIEKVDFRQIDNLNGIKDSNKFDRYRAQVLISRHLEGTKFFMKIETH